MNDVEFRRKSLHRFHTTGISPRYIPPELRSAVRRKLMMIEHSQNINDLRIPPSNHLERLRGDLADYHSIRVNNQYGIIFIWTTKGATHVDFTDYH